MAMASFALLLRFLTWWQAALCAVAAFLFNLFVLPRIGGRLAYRPSDAARGLPAGNPVLSAVGAAPDPRVSRGGPTSWPRRGASWPSATARRRSSARRSRGPRLPVEPATRASPGSLAFVAAGALAGIALAGGRARPSCRRRRCCSRSPRPCSRRSPRRCVESIRVRLDDNISVPIARGDRPRRPRADGRRVVGGGLAVAAALAGAGRRGQRAGCDARVVRGHGHREPAPSCGAIIGIVGVRVRRRRGLGDAVRVVPGGGALDAGWASSGRAVLGIAEERGGRRGPGNAIANTGLAAFAAIVAALSPVRDGALLAMVAALAAGASDTVASEIGKAWGTKTYLFPTFKSVRPGTSGAVSLEGTGAGLVAALALAALGAGARARSRGTRSGSWRSAPRRARSWKARSAPRSKPRARSTTTC